MRDGGRRRNKKEEEKKRKEAENDNDDDSSNQNDYVLRAASKLYKMGKRPTTTKKRGKEAVSSCNVL